MANMVDLQGNPKIIPLYPGTYEERMVTSSAVQPAPIEIIAYEQSTNASLTLNDKQTLFVTPKEVDEIITVNIGEGKFITLGLCLHNRH